VTPLDVWYAPKPPIVKTIKGHTRTTAKRLNASLFGGSHAKAAALQKLEEKLRKAKSEVE